MHLERHDGTYVERNRVAATTAENARRTSARSSTVVTWKAEQLVEELDAVRPPRTVAHQQRSPP